MPQAARLRPTRVAPSDVSVLRAILAKPGATRSAVAAAAGIGRRAVAASVRRLEKLGAIQPTAVEGKASSRSTGLLPSPSFGSVTAVWVEPGRVKAASVDFSGGLGPHVLLSAPTAEDVPAAIAEATARLARTGGLAPELGRRCVIAGPLARRSARIEGGPLDLTEMEACTSSSAVGLVYSAAPSPANVRLSVDLAAGTASLLSGGRPTADLDLTAFPAWADTRRPETGSEARLRAFHDVVMWLLACVHPDECILFFSRAVGQEWDFLEDFRSRVARSGREEGCFVRIVEPAEWDWAEGVRRIVLADWLDEA